MTPGRLVQYRTAATTALLAIVVVLIRWAMWSAGIHGVELTPLVSAIVSAGVFVVGLVVAGLLADYKAAERTPTELAASLHAVLKEAESMHRTWASPDVPRLRARLTAVVEGLAEDLADGKSRHAQQAVDDLSASFEEMDQSEIPANYVVRMRAEQAAMRKTIMQIYYLQRETFLPSAKAMIVSMIAIILTAMTFTDFEGLGVSLVTVGFLTFFFVYLLRLLGIIDRPFSRTAERTDDDVSTHLLTEFLLHASATGDELDAETVEAQAEQLEDLGEEAQGPA